MSIRYHLGLLSFSVGHDANGVERRKGFPMFMKAMQDLSEVLGVETQKLGLNESLTINIGSQAVGNTGTFYSPAYRLLNLSTNTGPSFLAHEWFHALDGHVHGIRSLSSTGAFSELVDTIKTLPLYQRCVDMDEKRGMNYFVKAEELTARAFESYVEYWLVSRCRGNDYLVSTDGQELVYCQGDELAQLTPLIEQAIAQGLAARH